MSESSVLVEHPGLTVECAEVGEGVRRAALIGDLDLATVELVEEAVAKQIAHDEVAKLVLDLDRLEFVSSTGMAMLVRLRTRAAERDKELTIERLSSSVARLFEITGMSGEFGLAGANGRTRLSS